MAEIHNSERHSIGLKNLHAAWRRSEGFQSPHDFFDGMAASGCSRSRFKRIINIESAERMQLNRKFALVTDQRETHAAVRRLNLLGAVLLSSISVLPAPGIRGIQHGSLQTRPSKKKSFGLAVRFHRLVVIQMITRQIGEYTHFKVRSLHAPLIEPNGTRFHHKTLGTGLFKILEDPLQRGCIRRCQMRSRDLPSGEEDTDCTDDAGRRAQSGQKRGRPERSGRLAVCASHGHACHVSRGFIVKARGDFAEPLAQVLHRLSGQRIVFRTLARFSLIDHARRSPGSCYTDKSAAVDLFTRYGAEDIARLHLSAVEPKMCTRMCEIFEPRHRIFDRLIHE